MIATDAPRRSQSKAVRSPVGPPKLALEGEQREVCVLVFFTSNNNQVHGCDISIDGTHVDK